LPNLKKNIVSSFNCSDFGEVGGIGLILKGYSTTEQLSIIGQIIDMRYKYRQNMWQLFIDFKKAYDRIHRVSLYNIMYDFGFPKKLIILTKMCMEDTKYRVRTQNVTSGTFKVETGLKQGRLCPQYFSIVL